MNIMFAAVMVAAVLTIGFGLYKLGRKLQEKLNYLTTVSNLVQYSKDIIYYCELKPAIKYRYLSPAINAILSPNIAEESMKNPYTAFERIHPEDLPLLQKKVSGDIDYSKPLILRWRNDKGEYIWFEEYATPIYQHGEVVAVQGIIRNINDKVELQQMLEYKASHDSLTALYNRGYFESKLEQYDQKNDVSAAIFIFDLDELKAVNDRYGHKMGDSLIKEAAKILNGFSGEGLIAARIGGDEFAMLLVNANLEHVKQLMNEIERFIDVLNQNEARPYKINMSKGYAWTKTSLGKMEELYIEADNRMYREKNRKREQSISFR